MTTTIEQFIPSTYQQAIFDFVQNGTGHGMVIAVAGSGKSTTLRQASKLLKSTDKAVFLAFNVSIKDEMNKKLQEEGSSMRAMTVHSLGRSALMQMNVKLGAPEPQKYHKICKAHLERKDAYDYQLLSQFKKLVSFAQMTLADATSEKALWEIVEHFGLEFDAEYEWPIAWRGVQSVLQEGIRQAQKLGIIDFNDMVWLPSVLKLSPSKYDWIFIDESQDLNAAQFDLVKRSVNGSGRLLFVGDPRQSIYGFSGADTQSIEKIIERTNATVMPLSICYRCPTSHIALCKGIVPEIEASPTAQKGEITNILASKLNETVQPGDLVLCRTTAPLITTCLELLRNGVRAKVRGRDLGANFVALLNKLSKQHGFVFEQLPEVLGEYRRQQSLTIQGDDADMKVAALEDKIDTIMALLGAYLETTTLGTLSGFNAYIDTFFSDESGPIVVLSTIHRAKGLENERVFILHPELLPHPKARYGWQMEQEQNLKYVAYSRAKESLFFVVERLPEVQEETPVEEEKAVEIVEAPTPAKRGRGRPKGTTGAYKADSEKKQRVDITLDKDIIAAIDGLSDNRSEFINQILRQYLPAYTLKKEE